MLRRASQCHTGLVYISFINNDLFAPYASLCVAVQSLKIRLLIDWSQVRSLPRPPFHPLILNNLTIETLARRERPINQIVAIVADCRPLLVTL